MDKTTAREKLSTLVARDGVPEATARTWVERFLGVFGWNSADPTHVAQEYRIRGRAARRLRSEGVTHRVPDYALIIDGRPVLYIDAKRFDVDIESDPDTAFQVRSYGWSAGFRLSYAFDFEELAVYDCRLPPRPDDAAAVARVLYLRHTEFLDRFDTLWNYFSREAIRSGSLSRLHPDDKKPRGSLPLDQEFEDKLSAWRLDLAKAILHHGHVRDPRLISAAAQRILDRIVFLRICEEMGLEELGSLHALLNGDDGFWANFADEHESRYRRVYDGILFPHAEEDDPTGVEAHLRQWWLRGRAFKAIVEGLYFPNPYRFDVIPIDLLGGIYEKYLGKRLRVVGNNIRDEYKPEYQRTKGAVYTPPWIVRRVVERTLRPMVEGLGAEQLLGLRILDPACGSASFLLGVYTFLEEAILRACEGRSDRARYVIDDRREPRLNPATARSVIDGCLFGVDIDPEAVEVARMSLALHYMDRTARDQPAEPRDLLRGIGRNIRHGNSLVGPDFAGLGVAPDAVAKVMPFDWNHASLGFGEVTAAGGFDVVVGNPPYIEVKRYGQWLPEMYGYLKDGGAYETTVEGKTDISIPFIERSMKLLKPDGRLGFIVQNRFFKTEYGEAARRWLRRNGLLEDVEDFRDLQVFAGRTTYTAILTLRRGRDRFAYRTFADREAAEAGAASLEATIPTAEMDDGVWAFDQPDLLALHRTLAKRHGTIGSHRGFNISVGLQTLYGKLYQIHPVEVRPQTVRGTNGLGEEVVLERKALRPLCRNRGFYPFRRDNADAWVIFPYDIDGGEAREIRWKEFRDRFSRTARYLEERKRVLRDAVSVPKGADRWHLYRYPKNLVEQARPKVLFPMTIEDTLAAVDEGGDVYQDNVNVNSIYLEDASVNLGALAAVFNASVFSALGRLKAGLNDAGWRKFNRQFAEIVPFPLAALREPGRAARLAELGRRIQELQEALLGAEGEGARESVRATLASLWGELDEAVESLYGLSDAEKEVAARYPRLVDRVALVERQTAAPEDESE